jgi:hypothetical protein
MHLKALERTMDMNQCVTGDCHGKICLFIVYLTTPSLNDKLESN